MLNSSEHIYYSRICGKLLGDGSITKQVGRKPRFQFTHTTLDFHWCNHCYRELKDFIPLNPPKYRKIIDNRTKKGYTESYFVQSKTSERITELEQIWYKNRVKVLPVDFIRTYLNEEALAWWYQDDGHLKIKDITPRKIILSTDNFTHQENMQLISILREKHSLQFKLDGQNRLLLYDQVQILYFLRIISKYIHTSMARKTTKFFLNIKDDPPKITSIYLPETIKIEKPTFEINKQLEYIVDLFNIITDDDSYSKLFASEITIYRAIKQVKKCYRIAIDSGHRRFLEIIKRVTGLQYSEIVYLTFKLFSKQKRLH